MAYNITEINELAQKLHLSNLVDTTTCAIEGMNNRSEQVCALVITTHNAVGKSFLKECIGLPLCPTNWLHPCFIDIFSGSADEIVVETEFGKINVDENTLVKKLSTKESVKLKAKVTKPSLFNKLVNVKFIFIGDFDEISKNEWVYKLASADKVYFLLDGLQIFNAREKEFTDNLISSMFSAKRCAFLIGNSKHLSDSEREEIMNYSVSITEKGSSITFFTVDAFKKSIDEAANESLELRGRMEPDVTHFISENLLCEIPKLKEELTTQNTDLDASIALISENSQAIENSKNRIKYKIDSYIKDYALILFEKRVNDFNLALTKSLTDDIQKSENINVDSKWVNKYMEFVWRKFISDQESWLKSAILNEVTDIETLVNSDLNMIIGQMDYQSQKLIKDYVVAKYNVHSFLVGKEGKTEVGDLSKFMKIGSLAVAIFAPLAAVLTFGGSELVKLIFKGTIDQGKKEHMAEAVEKMSKQMSEQVIVQATKQFDTIAEKLKEQTMSVYENLLTELSGTLSSKKRNVEEAGEMLSLINEIESTYLLTNN